VGVWYLRGSFYDTVSISGYKTLKETWLMIDWKEFETKMLSFNRDVTILASA
jgi:hypothetical protein